MVVTIPQLNIIMSNITISNWENDSANLWIRLDSLSTGAWSL